MNTSERELRQQVIEHALRLNSSGLSLGKSGNVSARWGEGLLITPSGVEYQQLTPESIVYLDGAGKPAEGQRLKPSSEWHFHYGIYRSRSEVKAVVHAHPHYCTALACTGSAIPAFHYMVAIAGGEDIPIADYALFGTETLSENVIESLKQRQACLLANHGMIAVGDDLDGAFNLAVEVENLASHYCEALQLGRVNILTTEQMKEVLEKFKGYGQRI